MYLVKVGEIFLKGKNRPIFEKCLINNLKKSGCTTVKKLGGQYLVDNGENLNKVFGITSYSEVIECTFEDLNNVALSLTNDKPFRVSAKRSTKTYKPSPKIEEEVGAFIVEHKNLTVNLKNPEQVIYISIIKDKAYVSNKKIQALGGLPIGCEGEVLIKVKDETLSTVVGFLMLKRGCKISPTKPLPPLKIFYDYKIKENKQIVATDETINSLQLETDFILRPLLGYTKKEINNIYKKIIQLNKH